MSGVLLLVLQSMFSRLSGGPTRNPRFDEQWLKAHATTKQGLPNLEGPGKAVFFGKSRATFLPTLANMTFLAALTNTFQREGIIICYSAGPTRKDFDLLLTFHEIFFYSMCVFLQADLPYSSQWRSALQVQGGTDLKKLLLHCYIQEAGVDGTLLADALQQWQTLESKAVAAASSQQALLHLQVEVHHVQALHQACVPSLLSDSVKSVCERIDSFLEAICFQCFGNFTNIHERLLTHANMRTLIAMVKGSLPVRWDHYMDFLGYATRWYPASARLKNHRPCSGSLPNLLH
jgi:hypothetical protein